VTLTVRLPDRVEQDLAEYCVRHRITKSEAVKRALRDLLRVHDSSNHNLDHPFIGGERGDGSDVSGNIKAVLRTRFRKDKR
jgi:Arc/MetJ-type ribon-helix-helix transcriptional regulator